MFGLLPASAGGLLRVDCHAVGAAGVLTSVRGGEGARGPGRVRSRTGGRGGKTERGSPRLESLGSRLNPALLQTRRARMSAVCWVSFRYLTGGGATIGFMVEPGVDTDS